MRFFFRLILLVAPISSYLPSFGQAAQDTVRSNPNYQRQATTFSSATKSTDKYHFVGFQANQILRQLVGGAGNADNPYLFSYSFNSIRSGGGMNFGLGFNFQSTDDSDSNIKRSTKSSNTAIRIGYDKKKSIGKKWIVGFGIDIFRTGSKSETVTTFTGAGTNSNTLTSKSFGLGLGPRFLLLFNVNEKIYLGTETTLYYTFEKTTSKGDPNFPNPLEQEIKENSFRLGAPSALFIILRF